MDETEDRVIHERPRPLVIRGDLTWRDEALCAEIGPEPFFLDKGGSGTTARKICSRCPVREPCLEEALAHGDEHGIWGGTGREERRKILIARAWLEQQRSA